MKDKIVIIFTLLLIGAVVVFFSLWWYSSNSLKLTKNQLQNAQAAILTLKQDNDKLVTYIEQRNNAIKELEKKYTDLLNNIPADQCGDAKPSKELLQYFRKAYSND